MNSAQLFINTLILSKEFSNDMNATLNVTYEQELIQEKSVKHNDYELQDYYFPSFNCTFISMC